MFPGKSAELCRAFGPQIFRTKAKQEKTNTFLHTKGKRLNTHEKTIQIDYVVAYLCLVESDTKKIKFARQNYAAS